MFTPPPLMHRPGTLIWINSFLVVISLCSVKPVTVHTSGKHVPMAHGRECECQFVMHSTHWLVIFTFVDRICPSLRYRRLCCKDVRDKLFLGPLKNVFTGIVSRIKQIGLDWIHRSTKTIYYHIIQLLTWLLHPSIQRFASCQYNCRLVVNCLLWNLPRWLDPLHGLPADNKEKFWIMEHCISFDAPESPFMLLQEYRHHQ